METGDPNRTVKNSLNYVSTCLRVVDTRRRDLYTNTPIVRTSQFEWNGSLRANHNVDHTSSNPSPDEFGQPANVAAQPRLGLLPKRGPGPGGSNPSCFVASWKNLKFLGQAA